MLAVLAAAPIFLGIVLKINTPPPGAGGGSGAGEFIGQVAENGVFLSLLAMFVLMTLVLPLSVAVVSGDSVAGEAGLGTLRTLLTVPAGRVRLLLTKYLMIVVFCFSACADRGRRRTDHGSYLVPDRSGHAAFRGDRAADRWAGSARDDRGLRVDRPRRARRHRHRALDVYLSTRSA